MRVPNAVHQAHSWVIAQIAPDFRLLDAWALPVRGSADEFPALVDIVASFDPASSESAVTRALFSIRFLLGRLLGWDNAASDHTTLRDRLPAHLRGSAGHGVHLGHGFVPLYRTHDEWAAEISNATVHGVLQIAWVRTGNGSYRGRLGVYVKPRGMLGSAYLALIEPFRHLIVYPALLRQIGRAWESRTA